jgi:hypothetical protein
MSAGCWTRWRLKPFVRFQPSTSLVRNLRAEKEALHPNHHPAHRAASPRAQFANVAGFTPMRLAASSILIAQSSSGSLQRLAPAVRRRPSAAREYDLVFGFLRGEVRVIVTGSRKAPVDME